MLPPSTILQFNNSSIWLQRKANCIPIDLFKMVEKIEKKLEKVEKFEKLSNEIKVILKKKPIITQIVKEIVIDVKYVNAGEEKLYW